ncbi:hypothetical protein MFLAVUS_003276 [Mucor flavus]|uniref:Uncharacterized protein n=1 Tax=Mucor flavus TaxID=439312 RepID=A0ABP9YSM1_9FUNG
MDIGEAGLRHLQVIDTQIRSFSTFHPFSKRLTSLDLLVSENVFTINGISGDVVSFLPDFTRLTSLEIKNKVLGSDDIVIPQILNACQNLTAFTYIGNFSPAENKENDQNRATRASVPSHGNKHLKYIKLSVNTFTKFLIQYFTTWVPLQQLRSFSITFKADFSHWIYENGSRSVMEFASCLTSINNLCFSFGEISESIYDAQTKVLNYWTFLGAIKENRNTYNLTKYLVSQEEKESELMIKLKKGKMLTFQCGIWVPDYFITDTASGVSNFSMPLPPATATVGPWISDDLTIDVQGNLKGVSIYLIKFSLNHFPQSEMIEIRSVNFNGIDFFACRKDTYIIETEKLTLSYSLLKVMFDRLPNITDFVAYRPILVKDDVFSNNTRVNFSGFKQLKELTIDLHSIHLENFEYVFLQLEHITSSNEYYKITKLPVEKDDSLTTSDFIMDSDCSSGSSLATADFIMGSCDPTHSLTATTADFIQAFDGSSITVIIQFNNKLCKIELFDDLMSIGDLPLVS